MAYTKYSLTAADNNSAPPNGAPEGMLPSAVNDTMRDMMSQIRDVGDGIRDGTYTMTAPKITGGTITGVTFSSIVITGGTIANTPISSALINNTVIGGVVANAGSFTTLTASGATTFSGATVFSGSVSSTTFSSSNATITGGSITGITDLAVADGGTGSSTLAANAVLLGNGTSALQTVAPSTTGNVLTSNGTIWASAAPALSQVFISSNQSTPAASNTAYTISHTLGVVPKIVRLVAVCTTAVSGYSIGDETEVLVSSSSNGNYQAFPWASSTQLGYNSGPGNMLITDKSTAASVNLQGNSNFQLKYYAFA